jgi:hypothetical protein
MKARTTGNFDPMMFDDPLVKEADVWDTQIFREIRVHPGLRRAYQNLHDEARVQIRTAAMDGRRSLIRLPTNQSSVQRRQLPEESVQPEVPLPVDSATGSGVISSSAGPESFRKPSPLRILTQRLTESEHLIWHLVALLW